MYENVIVLTEKTKNKAPHHVGLFLYNIVVKIKDGLIGSARFIPSPNCDERPNHCEPSLIVIHCISLPPGLYGGSFVTQLFTNTLDPDVHPYFQEIL